MPLLNHVCHATKCTTPVPPKMFMCKRHWYMLPTSMRDKVWALYRRGQEIDKRPSDEYLTHTRDCIVFVAKKEGVYRSA